jgi:ABC-type multidrug transport system ATPase subunit
MMTALTPQEALSFMARLRIGGSATRRNAKINELLNALGLEHCRNTRVGTVEDRGLSGGERKRLSIAMELLDDPAVLVLDEPTTGLDSKAAEDVIRILEKLAQGGRLVLATIHQPSWAVLELFQHLLILKSGRMVYDGQVEEVVPYFEELGQMMPKNVNPIDYIMVRTALYSASYEAACSQSTFSPRPPHIHRGRQREAH